jgi:hypothetical protein
MRAELLAWLAQRPPMTICQMIEAGVLEALGISARENLASCLRETCERKDNQLNAITVEETHLYQGRFPRRAMVSLYRIRGVHHD